MSETLVLTALTDLMRRKPNVTAQSSRFPSCISSISSNASSLGRSSS